MSEDAPQIDPGKPLKKKDQEAFCQLIACGEKQADAYRKAKRRKIKEATAAPAASRWAKDERIAARILHLQIERRKQTPNASETQAPASQPPPESASVPPQPRPPRPDPVNKSGSIDRQEVIDALSIAVRHGSTSEIVSAAGALLKLMPEMQSDPNAAGDRPCPSALVAHLASWSAEQLPPDQAIRQLVKVYTLEIVRKALAKVTKGYRIQRNSLTTNNRASDQ
jgi:hypothetical protein